MYNNTQENNNVLIASPIKDKVNKLKIISNSSRNLFTRCPRYFYLHSVCGVRRTSMDDISISFGNLIHDALMHYYRNDVGLDVLIELVNMWEENLISKATANESLYESITLEIIGDYAKTARHLLSEYVEAYSSDKDRYEVVAVEQPFIVPLIQTVKTRRNGKKFRFDNNFAYSGRFDLIFRDKLDGKIYIVDHKTTSSIDLDRYESETTAYGSGQRVGYVYAARFFYENVNGITYNIIRSKQPSKPKTTQCKKCKGEGCINCNFSGIGGIYNVIPDTTLSYFDKCLNEYKTINPKIDLSNVSYIRGELEKRGNRFLKRFSVAVSDNEIQQWCEDMYYTAYNILNMLKSKRWYRNLVCCNLYGKRCAMMQACFNGWEGNDNYQVVKTKPWIPTELEEDFVSLDF